jgi:hypothetical protein
MSTPFDKIKGEKVDLSRQDHRDEIIKRNKKLQSAIENGIYSGVKIEIEITTTMDCLKCGKSLDDTNYHIELDDCIEENIPNVTCGNCETIYRYNDVEGIYYPTLKVKKLKPVLIN